MKRSIILILLLLPLVIQAQRQVKRYYTEKWKPLPDSVGASYYRVIQLDAAGRPSPFTKDYFITGELQFEGKIKDPFDPKSPNDSINSWYRKDGTLERQIQCSNWKANGHSYHFYKNGHSIKQDAVYKEDKEVSMHFFDSLGKEQTFIPAYFHGGILEMEHYILKRTPHEASQWAHYQYVNGRVIVGFLVNEDGSLSDIRIIESTDPLLNKTALKIVSDMPKWDPATLDGLPTKMQMSIPIRF